MRLIVAIIACLIASSLLAQQIAPTEGYLPQFTRTVKPPARATIPLTVSFPEGSALMSAPVTFGVPFPRGALQSVDNLALLRNGREVPATFQRTATWHGPDGPVKWVLVHAQIDAGDTYALAYGTEVKPAAKPNGLRISDEAGQVLVSTGPLQFAVSKTIPALPHSAWLDRNKDGRFTDDEAVLQPGASIPYMVDHSGVKYALDPAQEYTVTVEESDPVHAIIKVTGWYTSPAGERLCQMTARLHAYSGEPNVRLEHTFVVAYDTDQTQLRDIALPFALVSGARGRHTFGVEGYQSRVVQGPARIVQDQSDRFSLSSADGNEIASGKRAAGWASVTGSRTGLTVAIRHFWQEFPRELEATGDALVAHLWPLHSEKPLDFQARAVLGEEAYKARDRIFYGGWYKDGLHLYDQAYGIAKSNDLLLCFHDPAASAFRAVIETLDEPVIVAASPEWMCRSDVMGPIHPEDPKLFAEEDTKMAAGMRRFELLRDHLNNYGLIDYGDANYAMGYNEEKKNWQRGMWRCWGSRFYGHPVMPWVQFLRTGDRSFLQWGIDNTRHVMDIDVAHLTKEFGGKRFDKIRGGRYGGNGGIIHYAGDMYDIGCDSHVDNMLLQYYLTGYRRALDVLGEEADYYMYLDGQPGGAMHTWLHRMTGGALRTMTALYNHTWDPRYLTIMQRLADNCYGAQDEDGVIRHDDVYMAPGLVTYYQATGDTRMKDLFLRCMKRVASEGRLESDPRSYSFYGPAMAYLMTGDASYLGWSERWRQDFNNCINMTDDPMYHGQPKGQWDYAYLTLHMLYMPYYLEAVSTLDKPVKPITRETVFTSADALVQHAGGPLEVGAEIYCYDPAHSIAVSFRRLKEYLALNPTQPRLVLRDAQGKEIASGPVSLFEGGTKQDLAPELPGAAAVTQARGRVTAPACPAGTYRLSVEDNGTLAIKYRITGSTAEKIGYATNTGYVAGADSYIFRTPNAPKFELSFKTLALRNAITASLLDSAGKERQRQELVFTSSPQGDWVTWSVDLEPAERGKLWRLQVLPPTMQVDQVYLKFDGVQPVIWASEESVFSPDAAALQPRPAAVAALPYPEAGSAQRIEPGKPLVIPKDGKLNAQQGTIEFWFRPEWTWGDISDRAILTCGQLRLHRRSNLGTYLVLGGSRQSGFVTVRGQWTHLALTWDAGAEGRPPKTQLYINGVDTTGSLLSAANAPLGDWTGPEIKIGGDVACTIDDLRISDTVRYSKDFQKPAALTQDAHTLLLMGF